MWLDTPVILESADLYFVKAKCPGIQVLKRFGSIAFNNSKTVILTPARELMYVYLPRNTDSGHDNIPNLLYTELYNGYKNLWVTCALESGCMDFSNTGTVLHCSTKCILSNCHRFEQSPLGIIVTKLFNTRRHYQLLRDDFAKISRNGKDSLKPYISYRLLTTMIVSACA